MSFLALVLPALYILEPALVVKRKDQTVSKESSALTQGDTRHYCSTVCNLVLEEIMELEDLVKFKTAFKELKSIIVEKAVLFSEEIS